MISCSEASKRLWAYLDGHIADADQRVLEQHLALCRRCCAELEFAKELRGFLARSANDELPDDVMSRLNQTLENLEDR